MKIEMDGNTSDCVQTAVILAGAIGILLTLILSFGYVKNHNTEIYVKAGYTQKVLPFTSSTQPQWVKE